MDISGAIATLFSLSIIFLGLPNQIYKNYVRKSVYGLSRPYWTLATCAYIAWVVYGLRQYDFYILLAHLPGVFLCLIILAQFVLYKKKKEK